LLASKNWQHAQSQFLALELILKQKNNNGERGVSEFLASELILKEKKTTTTATDLSYWIFFHSFLHTVTLKLELLS